MKVFMNKKKFITGLCLIFLFFTAPLYAETFPGEDSDIAEEVDIGEESSLNEEVFPDELSFSGETPAEEEVIPELLTYEDEDEDYFYLFEADPFIFEVDPILEPRTLGEIFPDITRYQKSLVMDEYGLRYALEKDETPVMNPAEESGIDLFSSVKSKDPSHIIEALVVVPYNEKDLDLLDIYNALGFIKDIKNQSFLLMSGKEVNIFVETTRIAGANNRKSISDPEPSNNLPFSETMYLRFTDAYIGDIFIRGDISVNMYGLTYSITNFTDIRYSLFRLMKSERYITKIYLEPIKEGILIYSLTGIYLPSFITKRFNLNSNISVRITALLNWIKEGLERQESDWLIKKMRS